jgi:predicted TIM-barrel fold metal-dependent hydrolase
MVTSIFDTHALAVSTDSHRYPHSPLGGIASAWSGERSVTAEQLLAAMDEAGIARTLLLQSSTTYGFNNDYLCDAVAANKERLSGLFSINVLEDGAADKMRQLQARGLVGMRIFTHGSTMKEPWLAIDDPRTQDAWRCAADLKMPVSTNCANLDQVENVLRDYPDVSLILEHVTRPQIRQGPPYDGIADLLRLSRYKNLYLRMTPRTFVAAREGRASPETYLVKLIAEFGSERLTWGSYYPPTASTLADIVADMRTVLLPFKNRDQNNILWLTACGLFDSPA